MTIKTKPMLMMRIKTEYMSGQSCRAIGRKHKINDKTVLNMVKKGKWDEERKELIKSCLNDVHAKYTKLIIDKFMPQLEKDLTISDVFKDTIEKMVSGQILDDREEIRGKPNPNYGRPLIMDSRALDEMARAFRSVTDVSHRIIGLPNSSREPPTGGTVNVAKMLIVNDFRPLPREDVEFGEDVKMVEGEVVVK